MIGDDSRPGQPRLDAAGSSAKAWIARALVVTRPRKRIVTPLAGDPLVAFEEATANHDAAADTGAENRTEDDRGAATRSVGCLRQREAICIVGDDHGALESRFEVPLERHSVEAY